MGSDGEARQRLVAQEDAMRVTTEKTIPDLAVGNPAATRVFEKLGIDYCCGGNQTFVQPCRAANLPIDQVLDSLEAAETTSSRNGKDRDGRRESLADLIAHIKSTHHK
jgi:regulator of cell morphogenesis and NO signaling